MKILLIVIVAGIAFLSTGHCGEPGGFSAGDAIVRPLDIAKDVAKTANERQKYMDQLTAPGEAADSGDH